MNPTPKQTFEALKTITQFVANEGNEYAERRACARIALVSLSSVLADPELVDVVLHQIDVSIAETEEDGAST